jgi:hypothetical protein
MAEPGNTPTASGTDGLVHGQVSDVSGGQVAVGGRIFQIDAASGAHVVINADTEALVVRRPMPVMRPSPPFPGLVGRSSELAAIRQAVAAGSSVEVVGDSGVGKTSLLRVAANAPLGAQTPDGVVAVPAQLGVQETLNYLFDACYQGTRRVVPRREELVDSLQALTLLVVLDDPELTREHVEALRQALASSVLLLSAREARIVDGIEQLTLDGLPDDDGVVLIERAVGRDLSDRERNVAARVNQVLNGTPLELVRFASLVRESDGDLVSVARGFGVDAKPADVLHAVQRSVSDDEGAMLAALAAFDAPVGAGPLAAFTGQAAAGELLIALARRGLVQGDDLQGWRARAAEPAPPEHRRRAAGVLTEWVQQRSVPEEVAAEIPVINAVLAAARSDGRWLDAVRLAAAAERPLALAGRWGAWEQVLQAGLSAAEAAGDAASARFFTHQLTVREDALSGADAASSGPAGVDDELTPPEPPWWRRHRLLVAALAVLLVAAVAAGVRAASAPSDSDGGADQQAPARDDADEQTGEDDGGGTGEQGTDGLPNLVAFTLEDEPAELAVGEQITRTVRVLNQADDGVVPADGGTLTVTVDGPEMSLVGGEPGCRLASPAELVCDVGPLEVSATSSVAVQLRGESPGSVVLLTRARDSAGLRQRDQARTFEVSEAAAVPCAVPDVVGLPVQDAAAVLQQNRFIPVQVPVEDGQASGLVLRQSVAAGQQVDCGTSVTIEFSGLT